MAGGGGGGEKILDFLEGKLMTDKSKCK